MAASLSRGDEVNISTSLTQRGLYVINGDVLCKMTITKISGHDTRDSCINNVYINPLRAKFCSGNKHVYLHFMPFFHIDMQQVFEILPQLRQGLT